MLADNQDFNVRRNAMKRIQMLVALAATTCFTSPAWAATSMTVVITQDQQPVSQARISLFNADTGTQVQAQEDDDDSTATFLLDKGRYRVAVDGKDVETVTASGTGSRTVRLSVPPAGAPAGTPDARTALSDPPIFIRLGGGLERRDRPPVGAGVIIEPGNERFATQTRNRINGYQFHLGFDVRLTTDSGLTFEGRIGRADDSAQTSVATGASPVGIVFHDRAPSGSTGLNLGATGLDAILDRDSEYEWFGAGYERRVAGGDGKGAEVKVGAGVSYKKEHDAYNSILQSTGFPGISSTAQQDVRASTLGIGVGLGFATGPAQGDEGLLFFGDTRVRAEHIDSELESVQRNLCNVCGLADRDDKRWGVGLEAQLGMGYRFKGGFEIGVKGGIEYHSDVPGVQNPETGDDLFIRNQPTQLYFEDSFGVRAGVYLGFAF
jgi:hypothetical protein